MGIQFLDVIKRPGRRNFLDVSANDPLPVTVLSGGGGGGGGLTQVAGADGTTKASATNRFPVVTGNSNTAPSYEKGSYAIVTDDIAQAAGAVSTNLAGLDAVDLQSISVQLIVLATYSGTLIFEVSNDGTNWSIRSLIRVDSGVLINTTGLAAAPVGPVNLSQGDLGARYFRVRQSAWTAGQIRVVATLSALSTSTVPKQTVGLDAGSNDIGGVSATNLAATGNLAALNAVADGAVDLSKMGQVQVQVTGTFVGTLIMQVSNDQATWQTKALSPAGGGGLSSQLTAPGMLFGHIGARYFRVVMSAYTSGTAVVSLRYNATAGEMPISTVNSNLRATAGSDGVAIGSIDQVALGGYNGASIDRLVTALAITGGVNNKQLAVASGVAPAASINAAAAPVAGGSYDLTTTRPTHTIQVDVTTTTVGTAGAHSVVLEGSLDGAYFTPIATVAPASTSTVATDASNHAAASVGNAPWRYVRARWASIPTSWTGTLTARVASA